MNAPQIQIRLDFVTSFCNSWPEICIEINGQTYWHNFMKNEITLNFSFPAQITNNVIINYLNKRNGPDVYDTVVVDDKIVQDQNCVLKDVYLNRSRCTWMAESSIMHYLDGTTFPNRGFMNQKGSIILSFPSDVYGWIGRQRKLLFPQSEKKSDIDYKNIYIPANENLKIKETMEKIRLLLQHLND